MIDTGIDPLGLKEQRRGAPTVKEIVSSYLARHAVHKKTGAEDKRCLERDVLPSWGSRKASDISKRDVLELIEKKSKTAPAGANALLTLIKIVFNWAIRVDLLQINPAAAVRPPTKQVTRDRTLSDKEISTFWRGLDNAPISPVVRAALRFILTTAQRPGEVAGMSWNEVDDDVWTIPSGRHKAGRQHVLPLSSLAIELIESLPRTSPFVFASPRRNSKPITRMSLSTALYLNRKAIGLSEPATPHDLRRTAATLLPADRFVKRLVLGHADREVTATYDRLSYLSEKRSGLEAWASKLREIIAA
jgi:integrase